MNNVRHYLRIDPDTQDALRELCRQTGSTKSDLMRRYVRHGVKLDSANLAEWMKSLQRATETIKNFDTPALHSPEFINHGFSKGENNE